MPWPLEKEIVRHFAEGLEEILVVEEKRAVMENQVKEQLYNLRADVRPRVVGKFDEKGEWILPSAGELTPARIARVIANRIPGAPHESLLVLDATTGQNGISQARNFTEIVGCSGIVLAKLDGTARGGIVVPIRQQMDLPVKYVGVGEGIEDLEPFAADWFVEALFEEDE